MRPAQCGAAGRRGGTPGVCRLLPVECWLHTIALCSRQQAPQTMRTLAALCHRTAQGQYAAAQQAAVLAPKLGLCGGLLAAILLWPAG